MRSPLSQAVEENGGTIFELSVGDLGLLGIGPSDIGPLAGTFLI